MSDWTVDIPLRTPPARPASKGEVQTAGTILGLPATLITNGTSVRLKVTGFPSEQEARQACPRLCFGLRYMSVQTPIAVRMNLTPQDVVFSKNPREAAANVSKSFGGTDFGTDVHGIMEDGAPAIYPTGNKILMFSFGEVTLKITGIGKPEQTMQLIAEGTDLAKGGVDIPDDLDIALELFNLSGFETSPRAAFIVHCTALEQLFRPKKVDAATLQDIERIESELCQQTKAATSELEKTRIVRLKERLGMLKRYSITASLQEGVSSLLAPNDTQRAEQIKVEIREIYRVRSELAHAGRADLGNLPRRLQTLLKDVILARLQSLQEQTNCVM